MDAIDDDLRACLEYNAVGIAPDEISAVVLQITGENDSADWHWIVTLKDGRAAYILGGCDYTGWDCQSSAEAFICNTVDEAIAQVPEVYQSVFRDMMAHGQTERTNTLLQES